MKDPQIGAVQRELSVVVPVFNEEAGLDALLARTIPVCQAELAPASRSSWSTMARPTAAGRSLPRMPTHRRISSA